jgi:hypothetical protein
MSQLLELERRRNTMNELVAPSPFCPPQYIEQLGCDGLTTEEIATSLGTEGKKVRQKLGSREFTDTLRQLGLRVVSVTLKNINGVEYEEHFLDTAAAKFFVARYENEMGNAYLAYLVRLDMAVEKKLLMAETKVLLLESKVKADAKEGLEPVTDDEYDLLKRIMGATLRRYGKHNKIAYKVGFCREVMEKFYLPGEDPGTCTYLARKDFKAALIYARRREFNINSTKEFTL